MMPEFMMPFQQASGAFRTIASGNPLVRLGEGDMAVYMKTMDIRTQQAAGQSAYNQLPGVAITTSMISTPTYLLRSRAEYDHHDQAAAGQWGFSLVEANRLGMRQGIFQNMRTGLLYGFNAAAGEGLLNTAGATAVTLPPDSHGNTTLLTYDNGEMAQFLLAQLSAIKTRTMQHGRGVRVTILGPQRILAPLNYQNIVQLTSAQRAGAGSLSTAGTVEMVGDWNEDQIEWVYDDTLIGQGAGGADAVIMNVPELEMPRVVNSVVNTNAFAELTPNTVGTALMLNDMAAPREIPTPMPGGAIDVLSELRTTAGWGVRPEALTILSIPY